MIPQKIIKDTMEKIVNQKMTIKEAAPNVEVEGHGKIYLSLRKQLKKTIKESLAKALTNFSDQTVLRWNNEWKPHATKKGTTREDILKVPVDIKGMSNITVGNLIHVNKDIKNKLENFIKEFEEPAPEVVSTKSEVSFPEKVGVLRWKASGARDKVYKYWEQISKKFDKLKTQTDKWIETLGKKEGKNLKEALDRLENYVTIVELEQIPTYDHIQIFDAILDDLEEKKRVGVKAVWREGEARKFGEFQERIKVTEKDEETGEEKEIIETRVMADKLKEASDKIDNIDPLLAASISNGLTKIGFSKQTLETNKRRILLEANKRLSPKKKEQFIKKLDELIKDIGEINTDFYLPNTQFTSKDELKTDTMWEKHEEYLQTIHKILFKEGSRLETGSPRATVKPYERLLGQDIFVEGRAAEKTRKKINPVLLDVIKEYYSPVSRSNTYFMGEPPKFMDSSILDDIFSLDGEVGLDFDRGLISAGQMEKLAEFVNNYRKGKDEKYTDKIKNLAYTVWGILDKLFKGKHREANKESIGWFLNKNNAPKGEKFMGEPIKSLAEKYEKDENTSKVYPITAMEGLINSPKFINLFSPVNPPTQGLHNVKPQVKINLFKQVKALNEEYKRLAKRKKDINSQILETHDVIRKSYGKPIYYGMCDLTYIEDMDYLLKRLSNRGYDLTAIELTTMVKSISSFDRIAKSFGVNEETVYLAKGLCR